MKIISVLLLVGVLLTALALVYVRHLNRNEFVALRAAHKAQDELNVEHNNLLLERATWSLYHVIEQDARDKLGMLKPTPDKIVMLPATVGGFK